MIFILNCLFESFSIPLFCLIVGSQRKGKHDLHNFKIISLLKLLRIQAFLSFFDHSHYLLFRCLGRKSSQDDCVVTWTINNFIALLLEFSSLEPQKLQEEDDYNDE